MVNNAAEAYKRQQIMTATPEALTLMLYNGCLKFIDEGIQSVKDEKWEDANTSLQKAQNIISEFLGALVCGLLIRVPMKFGAFDANPTINTFVSTCVSGGSFALMAIFINVVLPGGEAAAVTAAIAAYAMIVLGTATFNAVFNTILVPLMRKVLKR